VSVQERLGVALVEVDVAEAGRAEETAVRDSARGDVERNPD